MSTQFIITSIIEILMGAAVVFAVLREETLIRFEEKIVSAVRSRRAEKRALIIKADNEISHCA